MTNRICIYHKDCSDGKGAALAVWLRYGEDCIYYPAERGEAPPYEVWGREVVLVDYCYPREVLIDVARVAESVLVLDHHKTEADEYRLPLPEDIADRVVLHFDIRKSGATMAWEWFHPYTELPTLIWHIQDRDLHHYHSDSTKAIIEGLKHYPDFRDWAKFVDGRCTPKTLERKGANILEFVGKEARKWLAVKPQMFIDGHCVPVYNLPDFMVCDTLALALSKYQDSPFAVSYYDRNDKRVYSLRSRSGSDIDVGAIAKRFGGGGHKHSAGFTLHHKARHSVL